MRLRVLVSEPLDGASNMALDEALLDRARRPGAGVTLRLYRFRTPTLSFGYGQRLEDACRETACRELQIDCVRRVTGGRALLHDDELTYSVSGPPLGRTARQTYEVVTHSIRRALASVGVEVDPPGSLGARRAEARLPCLSVPSGHEITQGGKKIVASAMRYHRDGFLQHGSILWGVNETLWRQVTPIEPDDPFDAVGIRDRQPETSESALIHALSAAFAADLGEEPERGEVDPFEQKRLGVHLAKYRSRDWNLRRDLPPAPENATARDSVAAC